MQTAGLLGGRKKKNQKGRAAFFWGGFILGSSKRYLSNSFKKTGGKKDPLKPPSFRRVASSILSKLLPDRVCRMK